MSAIEESIKPNPDEKALAKRKSPPVLDRIIVFLSSVKFGIIQLCLLVFLSFLGMIIVQQNVVGFDAFYAGLTPAEKTVYGTLGLFDIYHSWYFLGLLLSLSLTLILASIDHFPTAWSYISRPKRTATSGFLLRQHKSLEMSLGSVSPSESSAVIARAFKNNGLSAEIIEENGNIFVFGESGKWNRLGAYVVHIALLTLFLGHFVALQTGFDADVNFAPGQTTNEIELIKTELDEQKRYAVGLPFTITCNDIQQKLIDPKGSIEIFNTLDWRTNITINDPAYGTTEADVSLNKPFSYRGYRFFQAQTINVGNARTMTLELTPQEGDKSPIQIELMRGGTVTLADGTVVAHESFQPDFTLNNGRPDTKSKDYNNPAVVLQVTPKDSAKTRVFAFGANISDTIPVGAPKVGYKWRLKDFEKAPLAHILSIKYDPLGASFIAWYFGGIGLIFALIFVFFISHKRIWALLDSNADSDLNLILGGDTNRNHFGFEDKFDKIVGEIKRGVGVAVKTEPKN